MRVVLVDDQELVRTGLRMVLQSRGVEVVGEASNGREALEVARSAKPDVVVMDVRMPVMDGVAATRALCQNHGSPKVLILTTFDLDEYAFEALRCGASGFLLKDGPVDELVAALGHVRDGDAVVAPSTTRRLVEHVTRGSAPSFTRSADLEKLTARETEVLYAIASGLSNAEIGASLGVSEVTVKAHVGRILAKLGLRDRTQAVIVAYEAGLMQRPR
ncbi:response regulator transcription factor [Rhodococcus sp. BP-149]|jgi:DNA-binding NarL/FixJ family response regulator|uniref:response regulator transcription factor n=1 Tax=unclassified Rhodococcus (in: high G+C Gram-positive bacteria) TaxID=192944 RepID=UPI001C9A81AC|nr:MULTISPECIES: response regulator transcription factor [unclassified Rhodococcus (in: high G+C Gram-positive bacteria)]MBY6676586.1 response regulator transcription factor [Rhodococcus sp. BP-332]MBY6687151.1 response regulator transcription factor [Rhodococcus sp. BP-288]MBY6694426.1 response regulator transcription factor [Rhodococcus sp. BP-188]MBY6698135.1 response regulator transcription factor [Rhodococcus sp. BP-285]MBY6704355.1 response regulator transcription factor [Rhodococcus sp.